MNPTSRRSRPTWRIGAPSGLSPGSFNSTAAASSLSTTSYAPAAHVPAASATAGEADIEARVRALEDGLDEYIRGIALASIDSPDHPSVIEDTLKERGDYDDF